MRYVKVELALDGADGVEEQAMKEALEKHLAGETVHVRDGDQIRHVVIDDVSDYYELELGLGNYTEDP